MNTRDYLDLAKKREGFKSDNKLAIRLGWSRTKISNYRNLPQQMDNEAARQMAELVDIPVMAIIADMEGIRQKEPSKQEAWKTLSKRTKEAGTVSLKTLITLPFLTLLGSVFYILCKIVYDSIPPYSRVNANC